MPTMQTLHSDVINVQLVDRARSIDLSWRSCGLEVLIP